MDLKTLKDIGKLSDGKPEIVSVYDLLLKDEILKWIKTEKYDNIHGNVLTDGEYEYGSIAFLKYFFNISDEDLK